MSLEDRVAKLEQETSNWRMLFGAVAGLIVVWLAFTTVLAFLGATKKPPGHTDQLFATYGSFQTVRATRLEVSSGEGKPSLTAAEENGIFRIALTAPGVNQGVYIAVGGDNAGILCQADEDVMMLNERLLGFSALGESGQSTSVRAVMELGHGKTGGGYLSVWNPLNEVVVAAQSNKMNEGTVLVSDANGQPKHGLTVQPVAWER